MTDERYSILFDSVKIGPKIAKNRFYQVPHCNGAGFRWPQTMAALRGMKAEGGWGVVCTEECEIHPTSDLSGFVEMRLWDDSDIPTHRLMVEAVHEHDALAGIQLVHNGSHGGNRMARTPALSPSGGPVHWEDPLHSRALSRNDIKDLKRWYREAAIRSKNAGYDIIYVYAAHDMTLLMHFLQTRYNSRTDEYGGSLENRARLLREVLEETKEAVANDCAVALRFAVDESADENLKFDREGKEVVQMLSDIPDLWDVNISGWENDSLTSRFGQSGHQEEYISFVKQITDKPVVGVGRFTSPDAMVSQIKRGILDFIGAARPSIADPFLPNKIKEGREDEIRECIGCNMCTSGDYYAVPIRCTQNPTMGEEYRKGWHPEIIEKAGSDDKVLVIGAGPAGLECALSLGKRGYDVVLAEQSAEAGGRVLFESRLPGLSEWQRVIDHRTYMLSQKPNVETYLNSKLSLNDVLEYGFDRVAVATGASWRSDFTGRSINTPLICKDSISVLKVDDILRDNLPTGHVVIFDDDYYYMANTIAEKLKDCGCEVTYVTTSTDVSPFSHATLDQHRIQQRLIEIGIEIITSHTISRVDDGAVTIACSYSGNERILECDAVLPVTAKDPNDQLVTALLGSEDLTAAGIKSVHAIGDCEAPGSIATAVYSGHQYARQLDNPKDLRYEFLRENYQPFKLKSDC